MLLACHDRENLSFNRGRAILNAVNHVQAEQIESSVDFVADKSRRLFNEALDLTILLSNDNTVASRVLDLCHYNGALLAVALVEGDKLLEGILTDDIRVEDKEESRLVVFTQD